MIGSDDVVLFDTNILVYARDLESPNYQKAKELQNAVNEGVLNAAITPQNLLEFYSVVTNQAKSKKADSPKEAIAEVKKYLLSPFELIVPTGRELGILPHLLRYRNLIGRRIFDVYLVATMLSNGV